MRIAVSYIILAGLFICGACDTKDNVAPNYEKYFVKYYGGEGDQKGVDFAVLPDGFIVLGNSATTGGISRVFLSRTDEIGNEIWSNTYGGSVGETAAALAVDDAGNYIIASTVQTTTNNKDVKIMKVDPNGNNIGAIIYDSNGKNDTAAGILVTSQGDYILSGYTEDVISPTAGNTEDILSIRTTADLTLFPPASWVRVYGFDGVDRGVQVKEKNDGTFLFFGTTDREPVDNTEKDGFNMFLFPTDQLGDPISATTAFQWLGTLGNETASQISLTTDGGHVMLGTSVTAGGVNQLFIARVRSNNNLIRSGIIGTTADVQSVSVTETMNGNYLLLGDELATNNTNIYLAKTSINGAIIWERSFGGLDNDTAGKVKELADGSVVFSGTIELESQTKVCLIKTNPDGELKP